MITPASVLADTFERTSRRTDLSTRVGIAVAAIWGLSDEDGEQTALARLRDLSIELFTLIDELPFDEPHKAVLRSHVQVVDGFRNFLFFSYSLEQVRNPLFQPVTISGLRTAHMVLASGSTKVGLNQDQRNEIEKLRETIAAIHDQEIPAYVKEPIIVRLLQVLEALEKFEFLGEKNLSLKVDALLGQISVASSNHQGKLLKHLKTAGVIVTTLAATLITASEAKNAYLNLTNDAEAISGLLPAPDDAEAKQ